MVITDLNNLKKANADFVIYSESLVETEEESQNVMNIKLNKHSIINSMDLAAIIERNNPNAEVEIKENQVINKKKKATLSSMI